MNTPSYTEGTLNTVALRRNHYTWYEISYIPGKEICFDLSAVWILIENLFSGQSQILHPVLLSGVPDQLLNQLARNVCYI
jgi:hypothetical protein